VKFLIRLAINAVAIYAAVAIMQGHGLAMEDTAWLNFFWLALIFAVINAVIKPVLKIIGCPVLILTLGLGTLLINTLLFYLTAWIGQQFNVGFTVTTFWGAFFGSIIVSVISVVLTRIFRD
jgi:putative membrane protein